MTITPRRIFAALSICTLISTNGFAHGFAGDRFFPPTITTDDPFAADELALPTLSYFKNSGSDDGGSSRQLDASFEFDKLILPHLSLGVSDTHSLLQEVHAAKTRGWQNLTLNMKYEFYINDEHEFILSAGLESEIGGTGSKSIGRDPFTTFTPTLYFGKGFGDLPSSLKYSKPFAITGTLGQVFPTNAEPNSLEWGLSLQYSIPYLQQHVQDMGLPEPFKNMIPLIEISGETGENRGERGVTTATINPGILYETKYFQVGAEALIPMNADSGNNVGVVFQVWIFLDDIAPQTFGHPIFGGVE